MKKSVKAILLIVAVVMVLSLAACGGKEKVNLKILETEYVTEDYAICVAKENTELLDSINTALQELIDDGTVDTVVNKYINGVPHELVFQQDVASDAEELIMVTNAEFPPYEFWEGEKIVGIDAELAAAIADKLGKKLVIEDIDFSNVVSSVQMGKAHMGMAGLTVSEERMESVNFTVSYATGVQVVIVSENSKITSVDDLFAEGANHAIGTQSGTTGFLYATWDIEDEGLGTVQAFKTGADAIAALVAGKLDCVIIDIEPAKVFVEQNNK